MAEDLIEKEVATTAADTTEFVPYNERTGGYGITKVDVDAGNVHYKWKPPTETVTGSSIIDKFGQVIQTKPSWETIKHVERNTDVPIYLEDGVTANPDKEYRTVIKDRLGNCSGGGDNQLPICIHVFIHHFPPYTLHGTHSSESLFL